MQLTILKWAEYQPRKDVAHPTWFRLNHSLFEDPDFFDFSNSEVLAWVYILSIASKKNSASVSLNFSHAEKIARIKKGVLNSAVKKLERIHCVRIRDGDVTAAAATDRQTNETNKTNGLSSEQFLLAAAFASDEVLEKTFVERKIGLEIQESWLAAFPDAAWIAQEIKKALTWERANPSRRKKNFAAFVTRWLTKGWDSRKTGPGSSIDWSGFGGAA